jgi:4-hydroxy-tetrahydrodipicolinate synthase
MDTQRRLSGLWLPLITPFRDGALDEASLTRLVRHYAALPVDGVIVAATTGEALTLDEDEVERIVRIAGAETRIPVVLGLSGSNTRELLKELDRTASWPLGGYLVACPYYVRPSQEGLYRHFATLAGHTARPILIYNIPYRTGVNMTNETMLRLAALPNIAGVKDCCADAAQTFDLLRARPETFSVLTGEDAQLHTALSQGADGGILAAAHVETARFAEVLRLMRAGDHAAALRLWRDLVDLVRLLFAEPNPAPIKHWLWRQGLIASPELRLPMTEVSAAMAARLEAEMARRAAPGAEAA